VWEWPSDRLSDWAAERTNFAREVAEMALATWSRTKSRVPIARGDLFEKRRRLMDAWAKYCGTVAKHGEVVHMRRVSE
jgi:hypothetical protein